MSLPGRFNIVVDGRPVARPQEASGPMCQANANGPPALFELQGGRLYCEGWAMGRVMYEDLSLRPKQVVWMPKDEAEALQPVQVQDSQIKFSGSGLAFIEDKLYAPLVPEESHRVQIQPM